jgi:HK97 family phage portal protein
VKVFGLELFRAKTDKALSPPDNSIAFGNEGWFPVLRESFTGAWQRNIQLDAGTLLSCNTVWACVSLIAGDISKLRLKLIQRQPSGIWTETTNPAYSSLISDPNDFQNDHQFWESWILSKLLRGNMYALKRRDARNVVSGLHVLNPDYVKPLISDDGSIFYDLNPDNISGLPDSAIVPAREIIHDRWNCVFHPLVGTSPIYACGLAATQGLRIQRNSAEFFKNASSPSGLLIAPERIEDATARRLTEYFNENFGGHNSGKIAIIGDNLKYQQMSLSAVDAQLIDQLKLSAEMICSVFHVPPYKVGVGPMPVQSTVEALNIEYYGQALQRLIENAESCFDRGIGLANDLGVEFDLDGLLRMDTPSKVNAMRDAVGAAIFSSNEARRKFDLPPVVGGESPLAQQQNFSLAALAKRDARDDPFAPAAAQSAPTPPSADSQASQDSASRGNSNRVAREHVPEYSSAWLRKELFPDENLLDLPEVETAI